MPGIRVFNSLSEALAAGFMIYDRIAEGYLVRRDRGTALELAIVRIDNQRRPAKAGNGAGQ